MDTREHRAQGKGRDFGMNAGTNLVGRLKNGTIDGKEWQAASFTDIVKGFVGASKQGSIPARGVWQQQQFSEMEMQVKNGVLVAGTTHRFPEMVG